MDREFEVQSRSKRGVSYIVQKIEDEDELVCNCPAGSRDFDCNHKDIIRKLLNRQPQRLEDLERIKEG